MANNNQIKKKKTIRREALSWSLGALVGLVLAGGGVACGVIACSKASSPKTYNINVNNTKAPHIQITTTEFELNEDISIKYTCEEGWALDIINTTIQIGDSAPEPIKPYIKEDGSIFIPAEKVTSDRIVIKLVETQPHTCAISEDDHFNEIADISYVLGQDVEIMYSFKEPEAYDINLSTSTIKFGDLSPQPINSFPTTKVKTEPGKITLLNVIDTTINVDLYSMQPIILDRCVKITAQEQSTIIFKTNYAREVNWQYSLGGVDWHEQTMEDINIPANTTLYLRGDNPGGWNTDESEWSSFQISAGKVSIGGSIMGLLDNGINKENKIPSEYCFRHLFYFNDGEEGYPSRGIYNVESGFLPATELKKGCYSGLFAECINLINIGENLLPAEQLQDNCYEEMFSRCTHLSNTPKLQSMSLASNCYHSMFAQCTDLTQTPELPATKLFPYCYYNMFGQCTKLVSISKISATQLDDSACDGMFKLDSALKVNESDSLVEDAFFLCPSTGTLDKPVNNMFDGCVGTAPATPTAGKYYYIAQE